MTFDRTAIISNCAYSGGEFPGLRLNINAKHTYALLEIATYHGEKGTQRDAKDLLRLMETGRWAVSAGIHSGGYGGSGHAPDSHPHITLQAGNRRYHVGIRIKNGHAEVAAISA